MANIAATDITVTLVTRRHGEDGRTKNNVKLVFGDGVLTYPAGGVPITKGKFGCPNTIESLVVYDKGTSGYEWSYDSVNLKLVAMQAAGHGHSLFLNNAEVADGATTRVNAGTDLLGANTGSDISVAGVADTSGHGGVVNSAAVPGTQPSAVAIAAQTLYCEVIGW